MSGMPTNMGYECGDEQATVLIQILPGRYARINGKTDCQTKRVMMDPGTGKQVVGWDSISAEVWVSPPIADRLAIVNERAQPGEGPVPMVRPTAKIVRSRTLEQAGAGIDPADVVDEPVADEPVTVLQPPRTVERVGPEAVGQLEDVGILEDEGTSDEPPVDDPKPDVPPAVVGGSVERQAPQRRRPGGA